MAYSRTYDIPYFLVDKNRKLRITALMQFLEDMAIRHSEACGVGLDYYQNNGVAWVLAKWDIEVRQYPEFNQEITITTEPTSFRNFFGFRRFEIKDSSGNLLARAHTLWIFVDTGRKKPIPVNDFIVSTFGLSRGQKEPLPIEAPVPPKNETLQTGFRIRPGDIDTNRHVNNIRFIEWALDTLPSDFTDMHTIRRVLVEYRKELTENDRVTATADKQESEGEIATLHRISGAKKDAALITFRWT